jgi:hypothetical protein
MALEMMVGGSFILLVLIIMLYAWAFMALGRKWRRLTPFAKFFYCVLFLFMGPVPILILLALNVGMIDMYHHDSIV